MAAFAVLIACAWLAGCAGFPRGADCPVASNPPDGRPLLWRAQRDAGSLYLFGSVHFGAGEPRLGAAVETAFASADELVIEIDADDPRVSEILLERARVDAPGTLRDLISEQTAHRLTVWMRDRGRSFESVVAFEPWFVTNLVVTIQLLASGHAPEHGIDRHFADRAKSPAHAMDVIALETAEEQVELFDALPMDLQVAMLEDALDKTDDFAASTNQMIDAWQHGDEARLEELVFDPVEASPRFAPFYDALFDRRNAVMTRRLIAMSADGKTRMVVVGAGHMLGDVGIPARLCDAGFSVQRISGG